MVGRNGQRRSRHLVQMATEATNGLRLRNTDIGWTLEELWVTRSRHLVQMATEATNGLRLRNTDIGWTLEELWVTGDLLDASDLEVGSVILLLDVPPAELPWLVLHPAADAVVLPPVGVAAMERTTPA